MGQIPKGIQALWEYLLLFVKSPLSTELWWALPWDASFYLHNFHILAKEAWR